MTNEPRIAKLQELLARIQKRANEPRLAAPKPIAAAPPVAPEPIAQPSIEKPVSAPPLPSTPSPFKPAPSTPQMEAVRDRPHVETRGWESPLDALLPGMGTPEAPPIDLSPKPPAPMEIEPVAVQQPIAPPQEPTIQTSGPEPAEVEAISGEYAVYRDEPAPETKTFAREEEEEEAPPLELEELGPAEEITDETVVEIQVEPPASEEEIVARTKSGPAPAPVPESEPEPLEEPPASGRELVAAPTESSRMKVAAPLKEEPVVLEPAVLEPAILEPAMVEPPPPREAIVGPASLPPTRIEEIEPPPETPRTHAPLMSAPAVVATPSAPPPAVGEPPPKTPIPVAAPPEPVVESVQLRAPGLPEIPTERTVVSLEAAVIKPNVTPKDVAAFVEAARKPMPTTFAELLDDALSL